MLKSKNVMNFQDQMNNYLNKIKKKRINFKIISKIWLNKIIKKLFLANKNKMKIMKYKIVSNIPKMLKNYYRMMVIIE